MRPRVFVDTSALFAGVWSAEGGARAVLRLGEVGAVQLVVSSQVLAEIEDVVQRKAPDLLGRMALLFAKCGLECAMLPPPPDLVDRLILLVNHRADAGVLASAVASQSDYYLTHNARHFLSNHALREHVALSIGDPGDFLKWYRGQLEAISSEAVSRRG
jgi:predicted nucleic acid-binding protein